MPIEQVTVTLIIKRSGKITDSLRVTRGESGQLGALLTTGDLRRLIGRLTLMAESLEQQYVKEHEHGY